MVIHADLDRHNSQQRHDQGNEIETTTPANAQELESWCGQVHPLQVGAIQHPQHLQRRVFDRHLLQSDNESLLLTNSKGYRDDKPGAAGEVQVHHSSALKVHNAQ
jgi:hypothetical protein